MGLWTNSDGLRVKLGTTEAEVGRGGEFNKGGTHREYEVVIDLANLGSASALLEDTDNITFPIGFTLTEVEVTNETAATGTNATLNLGWVRASDYSTAYDVDGLLAAAPLTDFDAVGETKTYRVGVTGIGSAVGVPIATYPCVLVADYDTAAFTAGRVKVVVRGYIKRPSPTN